MVDACHLNYPMFQWMEVLEGEEWGTGLCQGAIEQPSQKRGLDKTAMTPHH